MSFVTDLLEKIDGGRIRRDLFHLSKDPIPFRKLNYALPGHEKSTLHEADDWIEGRLRSCGYDTEREACTVQAFGFDPTKPKSSAYAPPPPGAPSYTAYNIYAKKVGSGRAGETILVLAHKDSQSWVDSPGAYDNCVGTVATLEMARVLSNYRNCRTLLFLFCNEEHTPWTSVKAAENFASRGGNLVALFNLDGLGGKGEEDIAAGRKTNVTLYTTPEGKNLADLMEKVNDHYEIGLVQRSCRREHPGDDDGSFIKAGYSPCVANIGSFPYSDPQYHLEGDVPERVDIANVRMAAQATLASVLWLDRGLW
ncbi:MAG: M28 family peptidase [Candidatus Brockarchaeota archaeon]|nr:M28 family peptidase [Candidatus Brockarchaeota archaeon]